MTGSFADNLTNDVDFIFTPPYNFKYNTLISGLSRLFSIPEAEASQIKETFSNNSDILWDKIVSIEPLGILPVYDIEVEATHNFIAHGIVAHNTYSQRTEDGGHQGKEEIASSAVRISYEDLAQVPDVKNRAQAIIDEMKKERGKPYETKMVYLKGKKIEVINWFRELGVEEWQVIQDLLGKFRSIAGGKFLEEIYYLAIEPSDKLNPNALGEKLNGWGAVDGVFKLFPNAFNQKEHRVSGVSNLSGSVIHELGHTVADILVNAWQKEFPKNGNRDDYITPYAETNAKEDIAETMVAVILEIDYFPQPAVQKKIEFLRNALEINTVDKQPLCLTPDSLITLADGSQRPLIALKPFSHRVGVMGEEEGDMVLSLNEATGRLEPHRVLALLDMGVKPVYRITTASGKQLKTTLTHPYLTPGGWKKLKDIKVGDEISVLQEAINYGAGEEAAAEEEEDRVSGAQRVEGGKTAFLRGRKQSRADIRTDKDGVKFLQFQADRKNNSIRGKKIILDDKFLGTKDMGSGDIYDSYSSDRDVYSKFIQSSPKVSFGNFSAVFNAINGGNEFRQREAGNQNSIFLGLKDLNYGMASIFPVVTFNQGAGIQEMQHSSAFFSYPGNLFSQLSLDFTEALMNFLQGRDSFGKHGLGDVFISRSYRKSFTDEILNCNLIFNSGHNNLPSTLKDTTASYSSQDDLNQLFFVRECQAAEISAAGGISWDKIISIDYMGNLPVYDIEVEATHNFIAQGIVAHNTYVGSDQKSVTSDQKIGEGNTVEMEDNKGGIDFNPQNLDLEVQQKESSSSIISIPVNIDLQNFQGFSFQIISIQPVKEGDAVFS